MDTKRIEELLDKAHKIIDDVCHDLGADVLNSGSTLNAKQPAIYENRLNEALSLLADAIQAESLLGEGWVPVSAWDKTPGERVLTMDKQGFEAVCIWRGGWVLAPPNHPQSPVYSVEFVRPLPSPPQREKEDV